MPLTSQCDGVSHCKDGSDEADCPGSEGRDRSEGRDGSEGSEGSEGMSTHDSDTRRGTVTSRLCTSFIWKNTNRFYRHFGLLNELSQFKSYTLTQTFK